MIGDPPVSQADFESKYQRSADPWNFSGSSYERGRYEVTLQALLRRRYRRAFEPGCSIGVLSAALAERCEQLLAIDISPRAVALAAQHCAGWPNVTFECADIGTYRPRGRFDLIVFSELGYYFSTSQLSGIVQSLSGRLEHGGELVAVHWLGASEDHVLHGDEVHATMRELLAPACEHLQSILRPGFRLDGWRRR